MLGNTLWLALSVSSHDYVLFESKNVRKRMLTHDLNTTPVRFDYAKSSFRKPLCVIVIIHIVVKRENSIRDNVYLSFIHSFFLPRIL